MSQPIKPPTKVSLWSGNMSDAERLVHERLLLVFKEANEILNMIVNKLSKKFAIILNEKGI